MAYSRPILRLLVSATVVCAAPSCVDESETENESETETAEGPSYEACEAPDASVRGSFTITADDWPFEPYVVNETRYRAEIDAHCTAEPAGENQLDLSCLGPDDLDHAVTVSIGSDPSAPFDTAMGETVTLRYEVSESTFNGVGVGWFDLRDDVGGLIAAGVEGAGVVPEPFAPLQVETAVEVCPSSNDDGQCFLDARYRPQSRGTRRIRDHGFRSGPGPTRGHAELRGPGRASI